MLWIIIVINYYCYYYVGLFEDRLSERVGIGKLKADAGKYLVTNRKGHLDKFLR